jgi:mediator of replication checkpoint protein 1
MLRRKRNGNWDDLSDSDDGGEARRRLKRRQFAKMQRALFADERISKVAENPRNQAFLKTIEDRGSDDDMDFIFAAPPAAPTLESQESQASVAAGKNTVIPNSQPQTATATAASHPLANPRRTKEGSKKPSSIAEIRESLSNLLEEPSSIIPATEPDSSDGDEEEEEEEHTHPPSSSNKENENRHPRRSKPAPSIIDRITLKRNASSFSSLSSNSRLAFSTTTTTTTTGGGGGVPPLLRRATTNNSLLSAATTSSGSSSVSTNMNMSKRPGGGGDDMKIKKTAGKRSGVSYLARETERRAALAEAERRREARKWKGVEGRAKAVGGLFGKGTFE